MHLLTQIMWYKVALVIACVFSIASVLTLSAGVDTLLDAERHVSHTDSVLNQLTRVQALTDAAVNEGRVLMFTDTANTAPLDRQRDLAIQAADQLYDLVQDNQSQAVNVELMKAAILTRFSVQDDQIRTVRRADGRVVMNDEVTQRVVKSTYDLDLAVTKVRTEELSLLYRRNRNLSAVQWRLVGALSACMAVSTLAALWGFIGMVRELKFRKQVAERLRECAHVTSDGEPVFGQRELDEMLNIIESGELEYAQIKGG